LEFKKDLQTAMSANSDQ